MRFRYVFGLYVGCSFFALGPVFGQTSGENLVVNGLFTQNNGAFPYLPLSWTVESGDFFVSQNAFGCPDGSVGRNLSFLGGGTDSLVISQPIPTQKDAAYELSFYLKKDLSSNQNFNVSLGGTTVYAVEDYTENSCSFGKQTIQYKALSDSSVLRFSAQLPNNGQNLLLSNVSLVLISQSFQSPDDDEIAAQGSSSLTGNTTYTTSVTTANVGNWIAKSTTVSQWTYSRTTITDNYTENDGCSNNDRSESVEIQTRTTTIDGNQVTQYRNPETLEWYSEPPKDSDVTKKTGLTWDANSKVSTILPFFNTSKNLSTIPMNTIFADAGILSSLENLDVPGVNLLHTQVKNEKEKSTNSLKEIESIKRSVSQTLEEKAQNLNSISSKLGISFDLLDINALQDIEDLVAGRFNDFVLNKETNVQRLKREFRKDLVYFVHISKSLAKIEQNLSVVTNGVTAFAEKYDLAIEKMNQKIKSTDASLSKNLRICLAGLKKTAISLNEVFEHYAKGQKIVSDLQDKVDVLAEKTKEILPKLYLLDVENASASLEADLQAELAMMDVMDEEHLVAASGLTPSKQVTKGAKSGLNDDNVHVWGRALGQYMHQSKSSTSSAFSSGTGGALVGADWKVADHKLGFAATYMYTYMGQNHNSGHANINQGGLAPYGCFVVSDWKFDTSLYGGYTYDSKHRNGTASTGKYHTHSNSHAWQLAPHLQVSYAGLVKDSWWSADPYVMGDYVANWSSAFTEKGSSDYNTKQKASFSGFIRTEAGFAFNEKILIKHGLLILQEKAGWAYQRSLASSTSSVSVVGTTGAFVVPNNAFIQNLAVAEFAITFISPKKHVPNIEVSYGGQFGSKFISQLGSINLSKDF